LKELIEKLLSRWDGRDRLKAKLILQGEDIPAISERVGYTERTVQPMQARLYRQLGRMLVES
jgi:hypothetical protein